MGLFGRPSARDNEKAAAYGRWLSSRNPFAIASAVLGVFSMSHFGTLLIDGLAAIILGIVALRQLNNPDPKRPMLGNRLAWLGIFCGSVSLVIAFIFAYRGA